MNKETDKLKNFESSLRRLESEPSSSAWSRLERKLRPRRHVQRFRILRLTSIAASFLLLVGLGLGYLFMIDVRPRQLATSNSKPVSLEVLQTNQPNTLQQQLKATRSLFKTLDVSIDEGETGELMPSSNVEKVMSTGYKNSRKPQPSFQNLSQFTGVWTSITGPVKIIDHWAQRDDSTFTVDRSISTPDGLHHIDMEIKANIPKNRIQITYLTSSWEIENLLWQVLPYDNNILFYKHLYIQQYMKFNIEENYYLTNYYINEEGETIRLEGDLLFNRKQ